MGSLKACHYQITDQKMIPNTCWCGYILSDSLEQAHNAHFTNTVVFLGQ